MDGKPQDAPLAGQRVVVTRARHQAAELGEAFRAAGAEVVFLPLIEVAPPSDPAPLDRAAREVAGFDWLVFTSSNAVEAFLPRLAAPLPESVRVAVVGPATAKAARQGGAPPAVVASKADAAGLLEEMRPLLVGSERILVPRADDARPELVDGLRAGGFDVVAVDAYSKRWPPGTRERARELFGARPLGWVTFTSPRIAGHFTELFGDDWPARRGELRALSIGPVTTRELLRLGVEDVSEAASPSPAEMVRAAITAS